jgi:hypothetical protein
MAEDRKQKAEYATLHLKEKAKLEATQTFNKVFNKVADTCGPANPKGHSSRSLSSDSTSTGAVPNSVPSPFGKLCVKIKQAHICSQKCNKKTRVHYYAPTGGYDDGQTRFLATVTFEDLFKQTKSATTCEPNFESNAPFEFPVFDYHSKIYIDLFDEFTSNLIGDCEVSVFSIIERQSQKVMKQLGGFKTTFLEAQDKKITIQETLRSLNSNDAYEWVELHDALGMVVGKVLLNASFDEDNVKQCFSTAPPEDDTLSSEFTLDGLKNASIRISKLIKIKNDLMARHQRILQFDSYIESCTWLFGSIAFCLFFNAEYLPMYMSGIFLLTFLYNLKCRIDGSSIIHLLHDLDGSTLERQIGNLRVAVVSCEGLEANSRLFSSTSRIDPLVRCFYVPLDEMEMRRQLAEQEQAKKDEKQAELREKKHAIPISEMARQSMKQLRPKERSAYWTHRFYIGRTVTLENTPNPQFQTAQAPDKDGNGGKYEESMSKKMLAARKWINARSSLRKSGVKDAVLHNVTSSWKHEDGLIDWHCLKYPVLQETYENNKKVQKWSQSTGMIHFDVMSAHGGLSEKFIGRAVVPVVKLVDKGRGGIQKLVDTTADVIDTKNNKMGEIRVRLQLKLPFISDPFTELDRMNMESLMEMLDNERDLGLVGKVKKVRDLAMGVQLGLEKMANYGERTKNIFLWVHPKKSLAVFAYIFCGFLASCFIPMRYLMIIQILKDFWKGWQRKPKTRKFYNRCDNLLNTIPTDEEFAELFAQERENLKTLTAKVQHSEKLKVGLSAIYTGLVKKKGTFNTAWKSRFIAIRSGFMVWWKELAHAEKGMPERGKLYLFDAPLLCIDLSGCDIEEFRKREGGQKGVDDEQPLITIEKKSPVGVQFRVKGKESLDGKWVYRDFLCDSVIEFEAIRDAIDAARESSTTNDSIRNLKVM